jgi:Tol biopolymer transport system component
MLSPDGTRLLFSSDRPGGAGRHDLYVAQQSAGKFEPARRLPGAINTPADEFDATFLSDGATIVFARAPDFRNDRVDLYAAAPRDGRYDAGIVLPQTINSGDKDTYGPMLDWSDPGRITISGQRAGARDMDLYLVRYALPRAPSD